MHKANEGAMESVGTCLPYRFLRTKSRKGGMPEHETQSPELQSIRRSLNRCGLMWNVLGERRNSDPGENSRERF